MDWFMYTIRWDGRSQPVIRPMGAALARELGAELVPGFDPADRVAGVVVSSLALDGDERLLPMTAEARAGRL